LLPAAGCGDSGPELGRVTGTVTLDGKPLPKAKVEFQPGAGSPSYGETDENGHYELMYALRKPGAMVGRHVVQITTERMDRSDPTPANPDGELISYPEILLPRYHAESELEREVKSGSQTIDFPLKSK
jgi:hypothetical protein